MDFDIVIATRNRQAALRLSLPLMLAQERLPGRLIVVDASDDHASTRTVVEDAMNKSGAPVRLDILHAPAGLTLQRNRGLALVQAPVVFFPDDDALWFPHFAEAIMRIYERDAGGTIGAVGGTESAAPPDGLLPGSRAPSDGLTIRIPRPFERALDRFEKTFFIDPFFLQARILYQGKTMPQWLTEEGATPASTITGFRMSFRTDLIKRTGFDETLVKYGLFEDHDACMGVLASHCIVNAGKAKVFHYRPPAKRADDLELGATHILNRAYILAKHAPPGFDVRRPLTRYVRFKLARYLLRAYSGGTRRRLVGAWRASRCLEEICTASAPELKQRYLRMRARCLGIE
jgi:glycosyltransferase involved in cell wall biosynthesis